MNTAIRLFVLIPAVPLALFVGLLVMSGSSAAPIGYALGLLLIAAPPVLIVWTIFDHRKRSHLKTPSEKHA